MVAQQDSLDFLNKHTLDSLQTIVDVVHQLVRIAQNTQDSMQALVQKTTKFQEITVTNILLITELSRTSRTLPVIQEAIQKINTTLDELTNLDEIPTEQTTHSDEQMTDLEDNLPQAECDTSYNPEEREEYHHTNKTGIATPSSPMGSSPLWMENQIKSCIYVAKA